ncbi:MAG: hypothetical protein U0V70_05795 [Terriglobia bacterium]
MLNVTNTSLISPRVKTFQDQYSIKKILIAASDEHHRLLLAALLSEEGHTV